MSRKNMDFALTWFNYLTGKAISLPRVATSCQVKYHDEWVDTYIVGYSKNNEIVFELDFNKFGLSYDSYSLEGGWTLENFRPSDYLERKQALESQRAIETAYNAILDEVGDPRELLKLEIPDLLKILYERSLISLP